VALSLYAQPGQAWRRRFQPQRRAALERATPAVSPAPYGLVQQVSGSTTGTSLTLTFPQSCTPGNGVVLALSGFHGSTISGITIGGVGSQFGEWVFVSGTSNNAQIWYCSPVPASTATVVVTAGAAGIIGYAYEVRGWLTPSTSWVAIWGDQFGGNDGTGTSWSTGATSGTTLNAPEFVVGIGAVDNTSAVNITATAAGWTNEAAINGVTAGGRSYSAVSGYQVQGPAGASYTYSGTAASSVPWGAVVASFILMPSFGNWCGYIFTEHASYTGVSATFTLPSLTGSTGSIGSIWVGLGEVYQTGVTIEYDTLATGNVLTIPWTETVPGGFENWDSTAYPTKAGDSITASVQLTSTSWIFTLTNNTQSWTHTETKSALAVNIGQLANAPNGPAVWPFPLSQAEVIVEDEGNEVSKPNPDYGTVTFTNITTTPPIANPPQAWATVNTNIDQYPGPWNTATGGGRFIAYWVAGT
jgi:hypothetical protein